MNAFSSLATMSRIICRGKTSCKYSGIELYGVRSFDAGSLYFRNVFQLIVPYFTESLFVPHTTQCDAKGVHVTVSIGKQDCEHPKR